MKRVVVLQCDETDEMTEMKKEIEQLKEKEKKKDMQMKRLLQKEQQRLIDDEIQKNYPDIIQYSIESTDEFKEVAIFKVSLAAPTKSLSEIASNSTSDAFKILI